MKDLNLLLKALQDVFSTRLASVFIFGSKANSGDLLMNHNVDLFVIADDVHSDDFTNLFPAVQRWCAKGNNTPIIVSKEEFYSLADIYAVEYADVKWNYQIIWGQDLVESINVNYFDLRLQCERELKHMIMKLRGFYLEHGRAKSAIVPAIETIAKSIVVIFRSLLRLRNVAPSVYKQDVVEQVSSIVRIDKQFFNKLIGQKEGTYKFNTTEIYDFNEYLLNQLQNLLKQVSSL